MKDLFKRIVIVALFLIAVVAVISYFETKYDKKEESTSVSTKNENAENTVEEEKVTIVTKKARTTDDVNLRNAPNMERKCFICN